LCINYESPHSGRPQDFVLKDDWATKHLTLEDGVSHRTGMADHINSTAQEIDGKKVTPKEVVRNLRNLPMISEPRATFCYSNFMYVALSHILQTVTGEWLGKVLKKLIWDPLNMKSTFSDLEGAQKADGHLADGYY
jgi:CubicO group peptidase (beta-lactamase class C family)